MDQKPARTITSEELSAAIDAAIKILNAVGDVLEQNPRLTFNTLAKSARVLTRAVGSDCSCSK